MATDERVLIIDNRSDNVAFLTDQVLRPAGFQFSVVGDGAQGVQRALVDKPDLIITDINVPKLSGLDILQELREAQSDIPVILMTFHGSEQAAVRAFQLGARDYIIKPYKAQDMRQAIERALSERRLSRERDRFAESITRVNRQVERRLREINILSTIGKSVTALLDEDRLMTRVVEAAVYITGAEQGFLFLIDEESGDMYMRAARGLGEKYARGTRFKVQDSLAGQVVQTGQPVMVTGSRNEDRFKIKTGYLVKALMHVPLKVGDSVIGVLSVDHMIEDRQFDNHDLYLLSSLADYAAIALENSRLHTKLQAQLQVQPAATASPEATARLNELVSGIQMYRQDVQTHVEQGNAILSDLREQISSLETWLDNSAAQERSLAELSDQAQEVPLPDTPLVPSAPAMLVQDLDTILDTMVDGVLVVGQDDQIIMANQVAKDVLYSQLVGMSVEQVCDDPRWAKTYRIIKAAMQLEDDIPGSDLTSATTPLIVINKAVRASFRGKVTANHTLGEIVVILRDITAEREAQRAKDSFISSVSQELRTPTTSIIGYTNLLMGGTIGQLNQIQRRFLDRIRANAERIGVQLNDLLGLTIIDSQQLEIRAEAIDLVSTIHEASDSLRTQMAEKGQSLEMYLAPNLPFVRADPDAMYHVLRNLLQNAHRCSPEKTSVVFRANEMHEGSDQYVLVSVTDTGGGVAPQDDKKVFNRFYRSDNPVVPGLGDPEISLPIVKTLVEAHGGRVWLESTMGVGSTFTIILPTPYSAPQAPGRKAMPT
jgi:signal transduction histidine kinase/DNA-binding response OmpR family regulator